MGSRNSSKFRFLVLSASVLVLTGCENIRNSAWLKGSVTSQGASPLIDTESFEKIDLSLLLDPSPEREAMKEDDDLNIKRKRLSEAFRKFNESVNKSRERRNQIQERIIAASNQRCGQYKEHLQRLDATTNFIIGSLATAAAGAGAIFTAASTVRALAGSAAILSGVRGEFNKSYFQSLTVQVVTEGFESKRRETYENILKRRKANMVEYPVQAAIGDAITYHQQCSLISGLEHAAISIPRAENPGIKQIGKTLKEIAKARNWMEAVIDEKKIDAAVEAEKKIDATAPGASSDEGGPSPYDKYHMAKALLGFLNVQKIAFDKVEAVTGFKGFSEEDEKNEQKKELQAKIRKEEGVAEGVGIFQEIEDAIKNAKISEGKSVELEKKKVEIDEWGKKSTEYASSEGQGLKISEHKKKALQLKGIELGAYYDTLIHKWGGDREQG